MFNVHRLPLHGGSSAVPGSNSRHGHETVTLTSRQLRPRNTERSGRKQNAVSYMCSLNDALLPTGMIDQDETGLVDKGGVWDDVTKTVVINSTRFSSYTLSLIFLCHTLYQ
ncbi:hypothetical protein TNCV_1512441 [Trichonephila clavipes]|nr:hypothetical protein TNCV_1512441 [Trichonephila clavipes]